MSRTHGPHRRYAISNAAAFNARATFTWTSDRLYRIYVTDGKLFFVRIGGQGGMEMAVAGSFGMLGALFLHAAKSRSDRKQQSQLTVLDQQHPQELLCAHKHSFSLAPGDVVSSSIEPASVAMHGLHVGSWILSLLDGQKWTLQFEDLDDMRVALELLPPLLGSRLQVNAQWNEQKKRFEKN